jgi:DUF971 family protein
MKQPPFLVKAIHQKDNHTLTIDWSDGVSRDYRLSDLQRKCPCAGCNEESGGKTPEVREDVKGVRVHNIGRYALRIQYTSGCSAGIYSFAMLRNL